VDDVIATGGTAHAVGDLTEKLGATISAFLFLAELGFLEGRKKLGQRAILSLIRY
jgi:adenine phosphoribosyltransferase